MEQDKEGFVEEVNKGINHSLIDVGNETNFQQPSARSVRRIHPPPHLNA
jgi:hypothetical protein